MAAILFVSCQEEPVKRTSDFTVDNIIEPINTLGIEMESNGIALHEINSPSFDTAVLSLTNPFDAIDAGMVDFNFNVAGYNLAEQTSDANDKMCANSNKGQHIHLILNNEPYSAHYESKFQKELAAGNYLALAFLSRSYHESVKTKTAYVFTEFSVGGIENRNKINLEAEHMIYSRPKGLYKEVDTNNILLDFYLLNTELSETGNKVKVTINNSANFTITKWTAYFIKGLRRGTNSIKLELVSPDGKVIPGPYNTVERTIIIEDDSMDNTMKTQMISEELKKVNN